jgi:hypothetical protein
MIINTLMSCGQQRIPIPKEQSTRLYKGKVKKIISYSCSLYKQDENGIIINPKGCNIQKIEEFDEEENVISENRFEDVKDPTLITYILTTRRDAKGKILEKSEIHNYLFNYKVRYEYKYNNNNLLIEKTQYNEDKFYNRSAYKYDEYNCMIEEDYFNATNQLDSKYISVFDNNNLMTKRTGYKPNGELDSYIQFDYDKKGELIRRRYYNRDNKLTEDNNFKEKPTDKRDSNNNLIEYSDNEGIHLKIFDRFNRCTEEKLLNNGTWLETRTWNYRDDGALIEESFSTSRFVGKSYYKVTTKYKTDNKGNWVEKYVINNEDNGVVGLEARNIEYYN